MGLGEVAKDGQDACHLLLALPPHLPCEGVIGRVAHRDPEDLDATPRLPGHDGHLPQEAIWSQGGRHACGEGWAPELALWQVQGHSPLTGHEVHEL